MSYQICTNNSLTVCVPLSLCVTVSRVMFPFNCHANFWNITMWIGRVSSNWFRENKLVTVWNSTLRTSPESRDTNHQWWTFYHSLISGGYTVFVQTILHKPCPLSGFVEQKHWLLWDHKNKLYWFSTDWAEQQPVCEVNVHLWSDVLLSAQNLHLTDCEM